MYLLNVIQFEFLDASHDKTGVVAFREEYHRGEKPLSLVIEQHNFYVCICGCAGSSLLWVGLLWGGK